MQDVKILLVDDEPLVLRSMEKTLLRAGFDVETAADARDGLITFQAAHKTTAPFQVAVLDLNMPDLEGQIDSNAGLKLLDRLLELDANLPVVVLTAFDQVARAKDAIARGARAYFVKGREAGLVEIIQEILSL